MINKTNNSFIHVNGHGPKTATNYKKVI